jgi:hypothetical protein
MTKRAVIYDRVSVADPESQKEHIARCRAYAAAQEDTEVVAEYEDTASGFRRDTVRPGWVKVQEAAVCLRAPGVPSPAPALFPGTRGGGIDARPRSSPRTTRARCRAGAV